VAFRRSSRWWSPSSPSSRKRRFASALRQIRGNSEVDFKETLPGQPERILLNLNLDVLTDKEEVKLVK
jgi:hypothetical protein